VIETPLKATRAARWPDALAKSRPSAPAAGSAMLLHAAICAVLLTSIRLSGTPEIPDAQTVAVVFAPPSPTSPGPLAAVPPPDPPAPAETQALPDPPAPAETQAPPDPPAPAETQAPPDPPAPAETQAPPDPPAPAETQAPPDPHAPAETQSAAVPPPAPSPPPEQPRPTVTPKTPAVPHPAARPAAVHKVAAVVRPILPRPVSETPATSQANAPAAPPSPPASAPAGAQSPIAGDWQRALATWLAAHKTYPDEARRNGTEGRVLLRFTVDRSGRVLDVEVVRGAGSTVLDAAAEAILRNATLPPFTAGMSQDRVTVTVQLRYALTN
jgi:periplasmic protein TonB